MSKAFNTETRFRSSSPQIFTFDSSRSSNFLERQKEYIHEKISQITNSPRSREKIEKSFEDLLKSSDFSKKNEIVSTGHFQSDLEMKKIKEGHTRYKDLVKELKKERSLRNSIEKENGILKEKIAHFRDVEKQYEDYRLKGLKISDLALDAERLNLRIKYLLEENEMLKRESPHDSGLNRPPQNLNNEIQKEREKGFVLIKKIKKIEGEYNEFKKKLLHDAGIQKEKYQKLFEDKASVDKKIREIQSKLNSKAEGLKDYDNEIKEKIRKMKTEYKHKLRKLEKIFSDKSPDYSEKRIVEIEERLMKLQNKVLEQDHGIKKKDISSPSSLKIERRSATPLGNLVHKKSTKTRSYQKVQLTSSHSNTPKNSKSPGSLGRRSVSPFRNTSSSVGFINNLT